MAESSVQSTLQWLGNLLVEEEENLRGIKQKVEQLRDELDWTHCFLREADKSRYVDLRISRWVTQIQHLAYEAEDIIEKFIYKRVSHQNHHHIGKSEAIKCDGYLRALREAKTIKEASNDIEALRVKISALSSRLQAYGIKITRSEYEPWAFKTHGTNGFNEDKIIGLDDQVKPIVSKLMSEAGENRVIGICGKSGVGKTTLARKVYHNEAIRKHFERFAWIYMPQNCIISRVLRGILSSLTTKSYDEIGIMSDQELIKELYEIQLEKKCLVILDDVLNTEIWDGLKEAFPGDDDKDSRSKLLFTTHSRQVGQQIDEKAVIHEMRYLSYDQSWELLQFKLGGIPPHIFGNDGTKKIMEMSKKMLHSCQGIPLAIIALGGLLATLKTPVEWETLLDLMDSHHNGKSHKQPYEKVIELCYHGLPYYLKNCFLHLGNFPENSEIPAKRLCHMWVAEGIVSIENGEVSWGESFEDFSEHCLSELLQRGMVQVAKRGSNGSIKFCCLQDLMRDLCLKISKEENFLSIIDNDSNVANGKIRRMAIYLGEEDEEISLPGKNPLLRSLLLFPSKKDKPEVNYASVKALCRDSQLLRVLDLQGTVMTSKTLPKEIGDLIYLKYLSLKYMRLTKIPPTIGDLRWMETLDLRVKLRVEIPNVLWRLERLRNLYLPRDFSINDSEKLRLDNLKYLLTLKNVNLFRIEDVLGMKNLKKASVKYMPENEHLVFIEKSPRVVFNLTIFRALIGEEQLIALQGFHNLIKLELKGGVSVPINSLKFPPNLKKLVLDFCGIIQDPMPVLEKLPSLTSLCLDHQAYMGKIMICSTKGFPQLTYLRLNGLKNLEDWKVEQGAIPSLLHLEVKGCDRLTTIPHGLPKQVQITHI